MRKFLFFIFQIIAALFLCVLLMNSIQELFGTASSKIRRISFTKTKTHFFILAFDYIHWRFKFLVALVRQRKHFYLNFKNNLHEYGNYLINVTC